jgi:hypothetical protein
MAPHGRGRALHHGTNARPQFDRLGRRTNSKITADDLERQAEALRVAVKQINRRFGPATVRWAADLVAIAEATASNGRHGPQAEG